MKNKKLLLVIIFILFVLLISSCGAYAYFKTDIFKTPEQLFGKYLLMNIEEIENFGKEPFGEVYELSKTKNSKSVLDVTLVNPDEETSDDLDSDSTSKEVKTSITVSNDVENKISGLSINSMVGSNYVFNGNAVVSSNAISLQQDDLFGNDYYTIENRDLKKLAKTFGFTDENIETIPDNIEELQNTDLGIQKYNELKDVIQKYINKGYSELTVKDYVKEKTVVNISGNDINAQKVTLKMDQKEFATVCLNNLKEFINDEQVKAILADDLTEEKIKEIQEEIDKNLENVANYEFPEGSTNNLDISIYISDGKTVKSEINISGNVIIEYTILGNEMKLTSSYTDEEGKTVTNSYTITNNYANGSGSFDIVWVNKENKELKISITINKPADNSYKFAFKITSTDDTNKHYLKSIKKLTYTFESGINLNIKDSITNEKILNDFTEEDVTNFYTTIQSNIEKSTQDHPNSIVCNFFNLMGSFGNYEDAIVDASITNNDFTSTMPIVDQEIIIAPEENISSSIEIAIINCLSDYKTAYEEDESTSMADYLNIDNIQNQCDSNYKLELIDGSTIKVYVQDTGKVYTATVTYNGLDVEKVDVKED